MKRKFLNSSIDLIKKHKKYTKEEIEIITYGLEGLYMTITKMVVIIGIALALGILKEVLMLLVCYNIIRSQAFGLHATKSIYCLISSLICFIGGALICKYLILPYWLMIVLSVSCNICLLLYAPADTHKRPIINLKKRKRFKMLSFIFGIIYTILIILIKDYFIVNCLLLGMIEACIMILPITYKTFNLPYNNYKLYNSGV